MTAFGVPWSEEEIATLRRIYVAQGAAAAVAALPGRSLTSICHKAGRMGLALRKRPWNTADDEVLRFAWGEVAIGWVGRKLGRTVNAVYKRAQDLGLGLGVPEGHEYLSNAARRTGYNVATLRAILLEEGVRIAKAVARPHPSRSGRRMHFVDPIDVDDAIARWHTREDVNSAARRRGLFGPTLFAWLRAAGVQDSRMRPKQHWRVPTEVIDRVIAARRALETSTVTLDAAARQHGLSPPTLSKWLKASGIAPDTGGKAWRLEPETVARVVAAQRARSTCRARGQEAA